MRVGNEAELQIQNDSYGSVVLAAAQMFFDRRVPHAGNIDLFERLERLGDRAAASAFEPDAGLWEFRGRKRVHTHSVAMCWAACDRLAKIANVLGLPDRVQHWQQIATAIRTEVLARAWNEARGCFVESLDGSDLDASLLLLPEIGIIAHSDPDLGDVGGGREGVASRKLHHEVCGGRTTSGFPKYRSTFVRFGMSTPLPPRVAGKKRVKYSRIYLGAAQSSGPAFRRHRSDADRHAMGQFSAEAYSMVGLVISAMRLSTTWEEAFWRGSS